MSATEIQTSATIPAGTYRLDPVHSSAGFAVKHMVVATFRGRFEDYAGTIVTGEKSTNQLFACTKFLIFGLSARGPTSCAT